MEVLLQLHNPHHRSVILRLRAVLGDDPPILWLMKILYDLHSVLLDEHAHHILAEAFAQDLQFSLQQLLFIIQRLDKSKCTIFVLG